MFQDPYAEIRAINRPYGPDEETGDFLYKLYLLLWSAPPTMSKWARQRAFEAAADNTHSWRVVGVTENALRHIVESRGGQSLRRGHWFSRNHRYDAMFGPSPLPMERNELLRFYFEHDTCVLVTKVENNQDGIGHWGAVHGVPEGIFTSRGLGVNIRKTVDLPWAESKLAEIMEQRAV